MNELIQLAASRGLGLEFRAPHEAVLHVGQWSRTLLSTAREWNEFKRKEFHRDIRTAIENTQLVPATHDGKQYLALPVTIIASTQDAA